MRKILLFAMASLLFSSVIAQNATEIIKRAEEKERGKSNYMMMTMKIVRPKWTRTIQFESCNLGTDFSMTLIKDPANEKGQTFMKRQKDMWSWSPKISRLIKMPPSMLSQGWMQSDFSNDDLLQESKFVTEYTHKIVGTEMVSGRECYKIELTPIQDADVVWGKLYKWVSKNGDLQLKTAYYDEDDYLVKTELASEIKVMDGREIPTYFELIPEEEENQKTIVIMNDVKFDINVSESFFSQQNMQRGLAIRFPKN